MSYVYTGMDVEMNSAMSVEINSETKAEMSDLSDDVHPLVAEFNAKCILLTPRIAEPALRAQVALMSVGHIDIWDLYEIAAEYSLPMLRALKAMLGRLSTGVTYYAARSCRMDVLQYAVANNCEWHESTLSAAVSCYNYHSLDCIDKNKVEDEKRLACLKYVYENGAPWDQNVTFIAAKFGNHECLKFAHEIVIANQYTLNPLVMAFVANVQCMIYAHENGYPWHDETIYRIIMRGDIECLKYTHECGHSNVNSIDWAADAGHLECLRYLHENGHALTSYVIIAAIREGYLDCLKYAFEHGCEKPGGVMHLAVSGGHVDCIQYLHQNIYQDNTWRNGEYLMSVVNNVECMKYMHENGCEWNRATVYESAKRGKLECLKYAIENGCELHSLALNVAIDYNKLNCVMYLRSQGYEWGANDPVTAANRGYLDCLKYMLENGCEWHDDIAQMATGKCVEYVKSLKVK